MGVVKRPTSRFYWMNLERPGLPAIRRSTKIPVAGATPQQTKENRQLAEAVYVAAMGDLARKRFQLPPAQTSAVRAADYLTWYGEHISARHRGKDRELGILAVWKKRLGGRALVDISRAWVQEAMTARVAAGTSAATVNREVDVLKAALREAVRLEHLASSPIGGMRRLRTNPVRRAILTHRDERRLLRALQPHDRILLVVGLDTLVRQKDLLALRWVDVEADRIWIRDPKDPVQGTGYWVPLSSRARRALKQLTRDGEFVFARRRRPRHRSKAIQQALRRVCERLGIRYGRKEGGITFHWATRRTGASRMLHHGAQLRAVQKVGHWKRPDTVLEIYNELIGDEERAAVELIAKAPRGTQAMHTAGRK